MTGRSPIGQGFIALALAFLVGGVVFGAENYTARAELRDADGKVRTAPVTISLDRKHARLRRRSRKLVRNAG